MILPQIRLCEGHHQIVLSTAPWLPGTPLLSSPLLTTLLFAGEMRGEAAPYSLVPSAESSLLQEKEGQGMQVIKEAANIITDKSRDKKRR